MPPSIHLIFAGKASGIENVFSCPVCIYWHLFCPVFNVLLSYYEFTVQFQYAL